MSDDGKPEQHPAGPGERRETGRRRAAGRPDVKIWDEDSQRLMESLAHDRKQATEEDYQRLDNMGSGVVRGDAGPQ